MNRLKQIITQDHGIRLKYLAEELGMTPVYFSYLLHHKKRDFRDEEFVEMGRILGANWRALKRAWLEGKGGAASPE